MSAIGNQRNDPDRLRLKCEDALRELESTIEELQEEDDCPSCGGSYWPLPDHDTRMMIDAIRTWIAHLGKMGGVN